jgi:hypothetical protein
LATAAVRKSANQGWRLARRIWQPHQVSVKSASSYFVSIRELFCACVVFHR